VGPKAGLDAVVKRRIPSPHRQSNLDHPIVQPVASRCVDFLQILLWSIRGLRNNIVILHELFDDK
jgi:hypothetical protein